MHKVRALLARDWGVLLVAVVVLYVGPRWSTLLAIVVGYGLAQLVFEAVRRGARRARRSQAVRR